MRPLAVAVLLTLGMAASLAAELPGDSLYLLDVSLQTSDGKTAALSSLRGKPLLITLFYSQCSSVCPVITARLQDIDRRLTAPARHNLRILMVSLDSERDTPKALDAFKRQHHIDDPRWIVVRASDADVRALAAVLGVRYRQLPDRTFNHSAVVVLADRDGVIRARAAGIEAGGVSFQQQVQSIAAPSSSAPGVPATQRPFFP